MTVAVPSKLGDEEVHVQEMPVSGWIKEIDMYSSFFSTRGQSSRAG